VRNPQEPRDATGEHLDDESVSECAFSPEQAAPGALEHAAGCADCSARIEELGRLLASLADLPEPEIPASVLIRLEATVERAWQEADAEADRESTPQRRRRFRAWAPLAVPVAALGVIAGAVVGISALTHDSGSSSASGTSAAAGSLPRASVVSNSQLTALASAALAAAAAQGQGTAAMPPNGDATTVPRASSGGAASFSGVSPMAKCFRAPARPGYTVAAVAAESVASGDASLVVYRNDNEPASTTTYYAVLYAGSCPNSSSPVLDQGLVSVSR